MKSNEMGPFDLIRLSPWKRSSEPSWVPTAATMLNPEELRMLKWLTSTYYTGQGAIIDGGCFLGGSTCALAQGLRDAGRTNKIDSYDLFVAEDWSASMYGKDKFVAGDSIRPLFDANVRAYADLLTVHHGDILADPWGGRPIEILFIDVAKTVAINDMIISNMFTCLVPNLSIVIQQDYLYYYLPWIHITMEKLYNHFVYLADTGYNSVIFGVTKRISKYDAEQALWGSISIRERMELMDRAISRWSGAKRDYLIWAKSAYDLTGRTDAKFIPGREFRPSKTGLVRRILAKARSMVVR
jgi:hypothetical protein